MTSPKRDLSALRGGLSGLRQPTPPKPAPSPVPDQRPPDPAPDPAPADHGAAAAPSPAAPAPAAPEAAAPEAARPRPGRKPAKPASAPAAGKRPIPVYLAAATKTQLEQLARAEDITLAEWVLDRLDEFYDELGEVFRPAPTRRSPLPPRPRIVRPRGEASTTVQLRLTGEELAAIEKLRTQLVVPSRSALLARVIELGVERAGRGSG
jgi:hypothetical protein